MIREAELAEQLDALAGMDLEALRAFWRPRFGKAPKLRSADLIRRMAAWRLQVAVHGGLDRQTRNALRRSDGSGTRIRLPVGSRLSREWKGIRHDVEVTADGYLHDGQTYRSLSTVSTRIAGAKWNGWRFFGVGQKVPT